MTEIKKLSGGRVEMKVSLPWEKWKNFIDQAVKEISEEFKIDGFRPGKTPRAILEKRVGREIILNNAADKAIQKNYVRIVAEEKLEAIGRPEAEIERMEEGKDLIFKLRTDVMPEATLDEKYKEGVKKINEEFKEKSFAVKEEEMDSEIGKIQNSRAKFITVRREARKGDSVEIDFSVLVGDVPIENGSGQKHPLIIGKGVFIPGFEENLIGMREGEEKEFELNFPKDYHKKDLAGKKAVFKVKMNLVQERQLPEINDDFARSLGKFETLADLKKSVREGAEEENKRRLEEEKQNRQVEELVKNTRAEIPATLLDGELEKMAREFEFQIQSMGMTLPGYLEKIKKTEKDLKKDWRGQAEKRVKSALAFRELVKEEKIEIPAEEVESEMNRTLQYYKKIKDTEKDVDLPMLYNYSKRTLENQRVMEWLGKL